MPFDGIAPANSPEIEMLDRMAAALATPQQWLKHRLGDGAGNYVGDAMQGSHCINGVMNILDHGTVHFIYINTGYTLEARCINKTTLHITQVMASLVQKREPRFFSEYDKGEGRFHNPIADYNNADTTTHADILSLIAETRAHFVAQSITAMEFELA